MTTLPESIGLFPLPATVLFPGLPLPLHVFEPRYRDLTAAALDGSGLIGMILLKAGHEAEDEGRPPIHAVGTAGRIVRHHRHPDGRYDLLLSGERRFRVLEEEPGGTFRRARVEWLDEVPLPEEDPAAEALDRKVRVAARELAPTLAEGLSQSDGLGSLAGAVAGLARLDPEDRQALLVCDRHDTRALRLLEMLAERRARLRALDALRARGGDAALN